MVKVEFIEVKEALSKSNLPDLDYALNPYFGCEHSCIYCYAREYTPDKEVSENWGKIIKVKKNLIDLLKIEVKKKKRGVVGLSTITDPYQPIEKELELSRKGLEILLKNGFKVSIQTKSDLVLRDLDFLTQFKDLVDVGLTITFLDKDIAKKFEINAPEPERRINALYRLSENGIKTWVFYGPIIPKVNDNLEIIKELVKIAKETNSIFYYDKLRIKKFMLKSDNPLIKEMVNSSKNYDWKNLYKKIEEICKENGVKCLPAFENKRNNILSFLPKGYSILPILL
ncbi:radical SAM protein [Nanoarchaeota archaeon NZ13-N]|nr:MAG: radical SAM protein [Nanoarchaeota archaeon NZ13-N]